jgi:hypothetical protein
MSEELTIKVSSKSTDGKDMLAGWQQEIHAELDRKLEAGGSNSRFVASKQLDA